MAVLHASRWERFTATLSGSRDGHDDHGLASTVAESYDAQLTARANRDIAAVFGEGKVRDLSLKRPQEGLLKAAVDKELERKARKRELEQLAEQSKSISVPDVHLGPFWYHALFAAFAVADAVLNLFAFEAFRQPIPMTIAFAAGVSVAMPVAAHFIGMEGAQFKVNNLRRLVGAAFGLISVLLVLSALSYLRREYVDVSHSMPTSVFFGLNTGVFLMAIFLSYQRHDSSRERASTMRELKRRQEESRKSEQNCRQIWIELSNVVSQREQNMVRSQSEVLRIKCEARLLSRTYWEAHQRASRNSKQNAAQQMTFEEPAPADRTTQQGSQPFAWWGVDSFEELKRQVERDVKAASSDGLQLSLAFSRSRGDRAVSGIR